MSFPCLNRLLVACWIAFASGVSGVASASPDAPAVLFLEEDEAGRPGYVALMNGFRQSLEKRLPGRVAIYLENLDLARFSHPDHRDQSRQWFRQKYQGKEIDVVVASGPASMKLAAEFREELWPDARIIGVGFKPQQGQPGESGPHVGWLTVKLDAAGTLDAARALMPEASRLVEVVGAKSAYAGMNEFILRIFPKGQIFLKGQVKFPPSSERDLVAVVEFDGVERGGCEEEGGDNFYREITRKNAKFGRQEEPRQAACSGC